MLKSLRITTGESALVPGHCFARFTLNGTDHTVTVAVNKEGAQLYSEDPNVPAIANERSDGS